MKKLLTIYLILTYIISLPLIAIFLGGTWIYTCIQSKIELGVFDWKYYGDVLLKGIKEGHKLNMERIKSIY